MLVDIKRALKIFKEQPSFLQPLYEGIVNSINANATEIKINFDTDSNNNIIGYSIQDNGEGFTNENLTSFLTLFSDHNQDKHALGTGRLLFLKVFKNIEIKSQTKGRDGHYVEIDFDENFSATSIEDFNITPNYLNQSYTTTKYKNPLVSRDIELEDNNIDSIKEKIFIELLPMFLRFKEQNKEFAFEIDGNLWLDREKLSRELMNNSFENESFTITTNDKKHSATFKLTYRINKDKQGNIHQFYGAADRKVTNFASNFQIKRLPHNADAIFCLTSDYLEDEVSDDRKSFKQFESNKPSAECPIISKDVKPYLQDLLNKIILKAFPTIKDDFNNQKTKISDMYPYLSAYLYDVKDITLNEKDIIKKAEGLFLKNVKNTREKIEDINKKLERNEIIEERIIDELTADYTHTGKELLANYIGYREAVIQALIEVDISDKEDKIHNLFMPKGETSLSLPSRYGPNIWILDDKFMSYNYAASDVTIQKICNEVNQSNDTLVSEDQRNKKPDNVLIFCSKDENDSSYKNVILIEFKKLGLPIDAKENAINKIKRYSAYIRKNISNVRSIYSYAIIDIDDELRESLKMNGFYENSFGDVDDKVNSFYFYNPNPEYKAHLFVISFEQLLADASTRNSVFLDILKEKFE